MRLFGDDGYTVESSTPGLYDIVNADGRAVAAATLIDEARALCDELNAQLFHAGQCDMCGGPLDDDAIEIFDALPDEPAVICDGCAFERAHASRPVVTVADIAMIGHP